jgi:NADH-quinone oxidoreductase subunit N
MSAPILWIAIPLVAAGLIALIRNERMVAILGGIFALVLALLAQFFPIDQALNLAGVSIRIGSSFEILGRRLILTPSNQPLLVIIFGMIAFWFFGSSIAGIARRLVPFGLAITSLLLASLAVEPFLYAALLMEMAVLLAIPLLTPPDQAPGRGVIRFLIFQTLSMPLILLSGFLLSGVEASPGDITLVVQSAILLGLGFALLLAIFPFSTWIPMISQDCAPYAVGFVLSVFPTISMLFGLGFLDRYSWLREAQRLQQIFEFAGLVMVVSGGLWAAFQRHIGRLMGYAVIVHIGLSLLALSLPTQFVGLGIIFLLIVPRTLALGIWSLGTTVFKRNTPSLMLGDLVGQGRIYPIASIAISFAALSLSGVSLLAGFPIQQSLWERLAASSFSSAVWMTVGIMGLFIGAIRSMATFVMAPENTPWELRESWSERIFIGTGIIGLFILGFFPQWTQPLLKDLSSIFEHLGK